MSSHSRFPRVFIFGMLFFLLLFSLVAYAAYQRKHSGVIPLDVNHIQEARRLGDK